MVIEEEVLNSPTTSEQLEEVNGPNSSGSVVGVCNEFDVNTIVLNVDKGAIHEPRNGLEFESKEAAYCFYREYARSVGFGITIKASWLSKFKNLLWCLDFQGR